MGLGLRAAAKELNISHVALLKAFRNGRVKRLEDGSFDVEDCKRALELNSHPQKQESARSQKARPDRTENSDARETTGEGGASYTEALRVREWLRVEKEKLNLAVQRGELAPIGEVNAFVAGMIMRARDILLRIGPELRDRIAHESDPTRCEEMVMEEIQRSLRELAKYG